MTDPFQPIGKSGKANLRLVADDSGLSIVTPVPSDAPVPPKSPLGQPSATYAYRDAAGREIGRVLRFDRNDAKEFRPLTCWRKGDDPPAWAWKLWPKPRPLYGLDRLAERSLAPVVVVEGEKAAEAAQRLLPNFVAITSPGGSNAGGYADWSALARREVTLWPDADAPGAKYVQTVASALKAAGAASVAIATPPAGALEGWDAADAEAEGWTAEDTFKFITSAAAQGGAASPAASKGSASGKSGARKRSGGGGLIALVDENTKGFFRDAAGKTYAAFVVDEHIENHLIQSSGFSGRLSLTAYAAGLTPPNKANLGDAQRVLDARARSQGPEKQPFLRVGTRDGFVYVNMGDKRWRVIEITPKGWKVLTSHDLPNIRSNAMLPLIDPMETDEGIEILRRFINADEDGFKLIVAWLLASLYPAGPFPILILNGEQGSAKSTLTKLLRSLVDPNFAPLRSMPRDESDIVIAATHSHVLAYDNLSSMSGELADVICRIATGGGMSSRAKFTDGDEFLAFAKNPVILNGIPALASRPDLASRGLIVRLIPISDEDRRTEDELERDWAEVAPRVLGVLLDALSSALERLPETRPPKISRMADFERLIEAAGPFLGWGPGEFADAYRSNRDESDAATIESEPLAGAIIELINDDCRSGWEGTPTRLLEVLGGKVSESVKRSRIWPATANGLSMRLERLKPVLRRHGVGIARSHSGSRSTRIFQISSPISAALNPAGAAEEL